AKFGGKIGRHHREGFQRVKQHSGQQRRPGQHEVAGGTKPSIQAQTTGKHHQNDGDGGKKGVQPDDRRIIRVDQRTDCGYRKGRHEYQEYPIQTRGVITQCQKGTRKPQHTEHAHRDKKRHGPVIPPGKFRPEVLERQAVECELQCAIRQNVPYVPEIVGIPERKEDEQVKNHHADKQPVEQPQKKAFLMIRLAEAVRIPQQGSHLHGTTGFHTEKQISALPRTQFQKKVNVVVISRTHSERNRITRDLALDTTRWSNDKQFHLINDRV